MKYSVIVPVYNAEKHLRRCIDSVIAQTFSDWSCYLSMMDHLMFLPCYVMNIIKSILIRYR